jgi:hypothetical protein
MTTTTDPNGSYSFVVADEPASYNLTETGLDPAVWSMYSPASGVIEGVVPGGAGYDFMNRELVPDGVVIYLNKTVEEGCQGGLVVDGTTFMGDARSGDHVTINGKRYQFGNNEQFRFTIRGDQTAGQVFVDREELKRLTFNVMFEVRNVSTAEWLVPRGFSRDASSTGYPSNIGVSSSVSITAINKNLLNEESTLTYRHPVCSPSDTQLRLDGGVWCDLRDPPGDATYLEFTDLHEVHDIQYGEGLGTMWICLMPGYDYLLAQGICISP